MQGIDHRQVQKELGDVIVSMHNPVVLSSTSVRVTWAVSSVYLRTHTKGMYGKYVKTVKWRMQQKIRLKYNFL